MRQISRVRRGEGSALSSNGRRLLSWPLKIMTLHSLLALTGLAVTLLGNGLPRLSGDVEIQITVPAADGTRGGAVISSTPIASVTPTRSPRPKPSPQRQGSPKPPPARKQAPPPKQVSPVKQVRGGSTPRPAPPSGSPYRHLAHGYDLSYPQCGRGQAMNAGFAVIGVNGGKAFSKNPCLRQQWSQGKQPRALYLNTGYHPGNASKVTAACSQRSQRVPGSGPQRLAYAIGCSEAEYSLAYEQSATSVAPVMWWLDVENANSWSETDLTLNQRSLAGMIERLARTGIPIGIYSTPALWREIVGGWSNSALSASWVAGMKPDAACAWSGFSGTPVWLAQDLATWPNGFDSDYAC